MINGRIFVKIVHCQYKVSFSIQQSSNIFLRIRPKKPYSIVTDETT